MKALQKAKEQKNFSTARAFGGALGALGGAGRAVLTRGRRPNGWNPKRPRPAVLWGVSTLGPPQLGALSDPFFFFWGRVPLLK